MFNIIDIIVILIILLSVFIGYKKGFVKTVISLVSFFVAIGLALMFYKPLAVILTENTTIDDWIIDNIISSKEENNSFENIEDDYTYEEEMKAEGLDNSEEYVNAETIDNSEEYVNSENIDNFDENTNLENIDNNILKDSEEFSGILEILEVLPSTIINNMKFEEIKNNAKHEIGYKISEQIMNLLSLIIIYVVVKVTLLLASFVLNGIMQIPVLKQLNEIFGMAIGAVIGFIQIYLAFAVITFLSSVCDISSVIATIKVSAFARILFENNLIINLLF